MLQVRDHHPCSNNANEFLKFQTIIRTIFATLLVCFWGQGKKTVDVLARHLAGGTRLCRPSHISFSGH